MLIFLFIVTFRVVLVCIFVCFSQFFILKYFKSLEKLQEQYNEIAYTLHLDSAIINIYAHLLHLCVDVSIYLSFLMI